MDLAVPMACMPTPMSGRNWMMRRLVIDTIRNDPLWKLGDYTPPLASTHAALTFYAVATSGGTLGLQRLGGTREAADAWLNHRLGMAPSVDANDALYQYEASSDYDASTGLERIRARVLAINNQDDERNPPELGFLEQAMQRVKRGRVVWVPRDDQTQGHATLGSARFFAPYLAQELADLP
ncbi:MAG: hypothetical protein QM527_01690 [Alphaproteobacteria bacterium]|nr:hypothetical protein [Alphaproteobacteria bacterium]